MQIELQNPLESMLSLSLPFPNTSRLERPKPAGSPHTFFTLLRVGAAQWFSLGASHFPELEKQMSLG